MSTSLFCSLGLLLALILCISSSPIDDTISYQGNAHPDVEDIPYLIYPKYASIYRRQPSAFEHPRASRNSWFRVSTYQHLKPNGGVEEKTSGDNLMRWG